MIGPESRERVRALFAGSISSIIATLVSQPLQVLKINLQLTAVGNLGHKQYILKTIRNIVQKSGLRGFWRGHTTCQYLGIVHGITLFSVFHESSRQLHETRLRNHTNQINYISGFLAGTCSAILLSPIDLINTRRIYGITTDQYSNLYKSVKRVVQTDGFSSLYHGILINWLQLSNLIGLKFSLYNGLCNLIVHNDNTNSQSHPNNKVFGLVLCGAIAGLLACIITFPIEVVKRHIYVSRIVKEKIRCKNIRSCAKTIYCDEGFLGFLKGLSPALLKSCLVTGICFTSFDLIAPLLDFVI